MASPGVEGERVDAAELTASAREAIAAAQAVTGDIDIRSTWARLELRRPKRLGCHLDVIVIVKA
jgi:hypothetical protein